MINTNADNHAGFTGLFPEHRSYILVSALLLILAGALRFHDLAERSMWVDEAAAALYSQGTIEETFHNTRFDNTSPIIYPLLLYIVQKVDASAQSVRFPSAVFSLLAVLVVLLLPAAGLDRYSAFVSALALTVATSQVHWAQQSREYSFSVLVAALMIYGLVAYINSDRRRKLALYLTLFFAPLIQYGLVLFGGAVIGAIWLHLIMIRKPFAPEIFRFCAALIIGSVLTIVITLQYQWGAYAFDHLSDYYYRENLLDLPLLFDFLLGNTYSMLKYLLPGFGALLLFAFTFLSGAILTGLSGREPGSVRTDHRLILLTFMTALLIAVIAVILDQYPYGAAHQCLFLAPVVAVTFGVTAAISCRSLPAARQKICAALIGLMTLGLGIQSLQRQDPYGEVEDIKSVLAYLDQNNAPRIPVYAYPSSVHALKFYGISDPQLLYGTIYPQFDPAGFRRELSSAMQLGPGKLWLILTSVTPAVENEVISHIPTDWELVKKVDATKAVLYLARQESRSENN